MEIAERLEESRNKRKFIIKTKYRSDENEVATSFDLEAYKASKFNSTYPRVVK
jgi:hypothetical protein